MKHGTTHSRMLRETTAVKRDRGNCDRGHGAVSSSIVLVVRCAKSQLLLTFVDGERTRTRAAAAIRVGVYVTAAKTRDLVDHREAVPAQQPGKPTTTTPSFIQHPTSNIHGLVVLISLPVSLHIPIHYAGGLLRPRFVVAASMTDNTELLRAEGARVHNTTRAAASIRENSPSRCRHL